MQYVTGDQIPIADRPAIRSDDLAAFGFQRAGLDT
jgi:hypothetical protein